MRPLPAVLLDLHEDLATGKLVLRRGRVTKSVDLVNGNPVSATATPRDETLGHFLLSSGIITEEQHREAVQRAAGRGGKLGESLVAIGALTVDQLIDQLGKQSRHKLVQALRWPAGTWRFEDASTAVEGMQLRMIELVLGGLRETSVEDLERLDRLDGMTFELTARGARLRLELRRVFGEAVIARLARGGASLEELERECGDRSAAQLALDALMLCDAVQASVVPVGLGAGVGGAAPDDDMELIEVVEEDSDEEPEVVVEAAPEEAPEAAPEEEAADGARPMTDSPLFDILFDDLPVADVSEGGAPIEFPEVEEIHDDDSGVVETEAVVAASAERREVQAAHQAVIAEHQRVQDTDHYAVLLVGRRATTQEIDAAFTIRSGMLERHARRLIENTDRVRLDAVRAAYAAARRILHDDRRRAAYDRDLTGGEHDQSLPIALDTEAGFRTAEEMMAVGRWPGAIDLLRQLIEQAPASADYLAALGWAEWMAGGESPEAADSARVHLNSALELVADHAAAHDYKGRIDAALGDDSTEALFHLERALELDPRRVEALLAVEDLLATRGELRRYERLLKRLLFRLRGDGSPAEASAWARLAWLLLGELGDPRAAAAAAANAKKLAPGDAEVAELAARAAEEAARVADAPGRAGWREALGDPHSGAELVNTTRASGHIDAAFLAASTMVALGTADRQMTEMYESRRVRGVMLPGKPLGREQWALLRHKHDAIELGGLIELLAPAIHALAPMTLADSDLDASQRIEDGDLPAAFRRLRDACARLLGVGVPAVYSRVELGSQILVIAADPAVLIAGDDALTSPERPELVFSLVRAMTFLWPGRAVGASRQGRVLRAVVMAVFREASGTGVGKDDPLAPRAAEVVAALPGPARVNARGAALRLLSRGDGLNLSLWSRSLSRTADRAGMLLCGDIPAAIAGAREVGELDRDLVDFAFSAAHVQLRAQLGLSRG